MKIIVYMFPRTICNVSLLKIQVFSRHYYKTVVSSLTYSISSSFVKAKQRVGLAYASLDICFLLINQSGYRQQLMKWLYICVTVSVLKLISDNSGTRRVSCLLAIISGHITVIPFFLFLPNFSANTNDTRTRYIKDILPTPHITRPTTFSPQFLVTHSI